MPTTPRKNKGTYVELPGDVIEGLKALAEGNRRTFRDELEHAARRHLAAPPRVEIIVHEPPVPAATVKVEAGQPKPRRGRSRKATPPAA